MKITTDAKVQSADKNSAKLGHNEAFLDRIFHHELQITNLVITVEYWYQIHAEITDDSLKLFMRWWYVRSYSVYVYNFFHTFNHNKMLK